MKAPPGGRPEDELLLLLLGAPHGRAASAGRLRALAAGAEWAYLLRQADWHGVVPLLAHRLEGGDPDLVPPAVARELEALASVYRRRALFMVGELRRLLRGLAAAGLPVIPLKGVALSEALYGRATLRVSTDIDLLVRREHLPRAVEALVGLGYRAEGPWRRWLRAPFHYEMPLLPRGEQRRHPLDLHWGLLGGDPRFHRAAEECWDEARPASAVGTPAWRMSPEWELVFLALHAAHSQWQGLRLLADIHQLCWSWALDWERVWAIGRRWEWEGVLELTIEACRGHWEMPPATPGGQVPWPEWLPRFPERPRERRWAAWRVAGLLLPRWRRRLAYALRLMATPGPNDYRWLPLPEALSSLYVVLRPLRWTAMAGQWCLRAPFRRRAHP